MVVGESRFRMEERGKMRTVSTWSLHRTLGRFVAPNSAWRGGQLMNGAAHPGGLQLLDLPAELKKRGYGAVQMCHFHLPWTSPSYLGELRDSLQASNIRLEALLIDDGDVTDPDDALSAAGWIGNWLDIATELDAESARVMAGRATPTPERIKTSAQTLMLLAESHPAVRVVTENWLGMMPDAAAVRAFFAETGDTVGLLVDLGNWRGPGKYDELAAIAPRAESCHAKCHVVDGKLDAADFRRSLQVLKDAGFFGDLSLIYDGPDDDEWTWLDAEYELVREVFGQR
jgi:sugar phosphate isomerase/epimerase